MATYGQLLIDAAESLTTANSLQDRTVQHW